MWGWNALDYARYWEQLDCVDVILRFLSVDFLMSDTGSDGVASWDGLRTPQSTPKLSLPTKINAEDVSKSFPFSVAGTIVAGVETLFVTLTPKGGGNCHRIPCLCDYATSAWPQWPEHRRRALECFGS